MLFFFQFGFASFFTFFALSSNLDSKIPLSLDKPIDRTDVGAYHRDGNLPETSAKLSELSGQFSLMVRKEGEAFRFL